MCDSKFESRQFDACFGSSWVYVADVNVTDKTERKVPGIHNNFQRMH